MIPGGTIEFDYPVTLTSDDTEVAVMHTVLSVSVKIGDWHPEVRHQRNGDPGWPAEGGEIEELAVRWPDGSLVAPLSDEVIEELVARARREHFGD